MSATWKTGIIRGPYDSSHDGDDAAGAVSPRTGDTPRRRADRWTAASTTARGRRSREGREPSDGRPASPSSRPGRTSRAGPSRRGRSRRSGARVAVRPLRLLGVPVVAEVAEGRVLAIALADPVERRAEQVRRRPGSACRGADDERPAGLAGGHDEHGPVGDRRQDRRIGDGLQRRAVEDEQVDLGGQAREDRRASAATPAARRGWPGPSRWSGPAARRPRWHGWPSRNVDSWPREQLGQTELVGDPEHARGARACAGRHRRGRPYGRPGRRPRPGSTRSVVLPSPGIALVTSSVLQAASPLANSIPVRMWRKPSAAGERGYRTVASR